jgi:hypothetical protein
MGTLPSPTERRRNGRQVSWQFGKPGLLSRDCRWRPCKQVINKQDWEIDYDRRKADVKMEKPAPTFSTLLPAEKR